MNFQKNRTKTSTSWKNTKTAPTIEKRPSTFSERHEFSLKISHLFRFLNRKIDLFKIKQYASGKSSSLNKKRPLHWRSYLFALYREKGFCNLISELKTELHFKEKKTKYIQ